MVNAKRIVNRILGDRYGKNSLGGSLYTRIKNDAKRQIKSDLKKRKSPSYGVIERNIARNWSLSNKAAKDVVYSAYEELSDELEGIGDMP